MWSFLTKTENLDEYVASQNAFHPAEGRHQHLEPRHGGRCRAHQRRAHDHLGDPAFSKLDPWALSKEYAANILGGSSVETAVKDMNTAVATRSSWPDRHSRSHTARSIAAAGGFGFCIRGKSSVQW